MLSSLPLVAPRDSHSLWYTRSSTFSFASSSQAHHGIEAHQSSQNQGLGPQHLQQQQHSQRQRSVGISPLAQLALDEQSVAQRKQNIQRFGATWIRPPGMAKTYQGELDDRLEREEVQQDMMEDIDLAGEGTFELDEDGQPIDQTEHDLDADIPDGESDLDGDIPEGDSYENDEDEEDEEVDLDADVPDAETETLWDDSEDEDEDDEEEDEELQSVSNETATIPSTREGSASFGTDNSPQQAMFSHDETYPDEPRNVRGESYDWRARSRYRRDLTDSMDVDSDD